MSNKKGGYKLVSLQGIPLLSLTSISGIYDAIEGSYQKPILLTDINIGGVEKNDIYVVPEVSAGSFVLRNVYGYDLTITSEDGISVASTQWATRTYVDSKTIYCHPLSISYNDENGSIARICLLVFNTSATPFTWATLANFMHSLYENTSVIFPCTGSFRAPIDGLSDGYQTIARYLYVTSSTSAVHLSGGSINNYEQSNIMILQDPSKITAFSDGVNAIN